MIKEDGSEDDGLNCEIEVLVFRTSSIRQIAFFPPLSLRFTILWTWAWMTKELRSF